MNRFCALFVNGFFPFLIACHRIIYSEHYRPHLVADGDTLTRLAVHYGCSEAAIKRCNHHKIGIHLEPLIGKQIRIPKSNAPDLPPAVMSPEEEAQRARERAIQVGILFDLS